MAVSDGQRVNAAVTNAAFLSRTQDSDTVGVVGLNHPSSGGTIANAQQKINDNTSAITSNDTDIADLQANKQDLADKGQPNGYAELDGSGKVPSAQLPTDIVNLKGNWDASTNTPTLADGVGDEGDVYVVSVAGTQDLGSGNITFDVGDWAFYNGGVWTKVINSNTVTSVNGQTGAVSLDLDDLTDVDLTTTPPVIGQALVYDGADWVPGESGSGSGVGNISYVSNSDAEIDASDHTTYDDGAVAEPVDGTGGSPSITVSRATIGPIRGTGSFFLNSTSGNNQGEGVHIGLDPIDAADVNKRFQVFFEYSVPNPGSNNMADGDYRVFVYDVDNATLIGAVENDDGGDLLRPIDGVVNTFVGFFNATDSLNYRLLIHTTTTDTSARGIYYDRVQLGPAGFIPVSFQREEIIDLTGSGGFTGGTIRVNRTGNIVTIGIQDTLTYASSTTVSSAAGALPSWALPDDIYRNPGNADGTAVYRISVDTSGIFTVNTLDWAGASVATTTAAEATISYPIEGSTNVISTTELTQKTVYADGDHTTGQSIPNSTFTTVIYDTEFEDDFGIYDNTTGVFTAKQDGIFLFNFAIAYSANSSGARGSAVLVNGVDRKVCNSVPATAAPSVHTSSGTRLLRLAKNDTVEMEAIQTSGGNLNLSTSANNNYFSINSLPDFSAYGVVKTPVPAARATLSGDQAIATTATTDVQFDQTDFDTHNAFDTGNFEYVAPENGIYSMNFGLLVNNHSLGNNITLLIQVNGTSRRVFRDTNTGGNPDQNCQLTYQLVKGDLVQPRIQNDDGNYTLTADAARSFFEIHKVTT